MHLYLRVGLPFSFIVFAIMSGTAQCDEILWREMSGEHIVFHPQRQRKQGRHVW